MIGNDAQMDKARRRLCEIRAIVIDKKPGEYPDLETEAARIFEELIDYLGPNIRE